MSLNKVENKVDKPPFIGAGPTSRLRALDRGADSKAADQSIRIPQSDTSGGAGFGDSISDSDREFASTREPVAHRLTYGMAWDVFDNWFILNDPATEGADEDLDGKVQPVLSGLDAKTVLSNALTYERIYGLGLVVVAFDDAKSLPDLAKERRKNAQILQLQAYKKTEITVKQKDTDPTSLRFGQPLVYNINKGGGVLFDVHWTRTIRFATRLGEFSVLDPIWDDLTTLRNIRWGMGQTMYRYGGGFPVIKILNATREQLEAWSNDPSVSDFMSRTFFLASSEVDFQFAGVQGHALDPEKYYSPIFENISVGSGVPEAILRGAQAGALAGSEVNEREYFKVISSIQSRVEPYVKTLIDLLMDSGQIAYSRSVGDKVKNAFKHFLNRIGLDVGLKYSYDVDWVPGFEPSELNRNQADLAFEQAQQVRLQYQKIDEVRELADLEPLENGEGDRLKQEQSQFGGGSEDYLVRKLAKKEEEKKGEPNIEGSPSG